jgi:hypothetical protein
MLAATRSTFSQKLLFTKTSTLSCFNHFLQCPSSQILSFHSPKHKPSQSSATQFQLKSNSFHFYREFTVESTHGSNEEEINQSEMAEKPNLTDSSNEAFSEMEIVILGTSSGKTSRNRGCTSYLVKLGM